MNIPADRVQLGPWTGGVVYSRPIEALSSRELADMKNCIIGLSGSIRKMNGADHYFASAIGSTPPVMGLGQHRFSSASSKVWMVCGTGFYEDMSGTATARTGSCTITSGTTNLFTSASCGSVLALASGTDGLFKWSASESNLAVRTCSSRYTTSKIVRFWDNRAWDGNVSAGEDRAYYSSLADIETVGANDFFKTDGPLTGMERTPSFFALHSEDGILGLFPTGNSTTPYRSERRANIGTISPYGLVVDGLGRQVFIRKDGIYEWDGANPPSKISEALDGNRCWDYIAMNAAYLQYAWACPNIAKNQIWFGLPFGSGLTYPNRIFIWDYIRRIWMGPLYFSHLCGAYFNGIPHLGGYADGELWKYETGTDIAGAGIAAYAETAAVFPEGLSSSMRWLFARHHFARQNLYIDMSVQQLSPGVVSNIGIVQVGDPSDALVTTFTIESSAIAGNSTAYTIDTELWGWDSSIQLRYWNNNADEPFETLKTECMFDSIGTRPKFTTGLEA